MLEIFRHLFINLKGASHTQSGLRAIWDLIIRNVLQKFLTGKKNKPWTAPALAVSLFSSVFSLSIVKTERLYKYLPCIK